MVFHFIPSTELTTLLRGNNGFEIPNYNVKGDPFAPEVLSNKVILTPPAPGSVRSSVWSKKQMASPNWMTTMEFRATGPERGAGRLQLWLAKDGESQIGTSSIYSAGKFEGLAIVVDTLGGSGGMVRGFLNDGSKDYKALQNNAVDGLAFGHCTYSYRNLGRPGQITVKQDAANFKVEVDGTTCFETRAVKIPTGYTFGITANSAEIPDSFEVYKLYVATAIGGTENSQPIERVEQKPNQPLQRVNPNTNYLENTNVDSQENIPDVAASSIDSTKHFADLHYRLQFLTKYVGTLQGEIRSFQTKSTEREDRILALLNSLQDHSGGRKFPYDQLNTIERRLDALERSMVEFKQDLNQQGQRLIPQLDSIRKGVRDSHATIVDSVHDKIGGYASAVPKLGVIVAVVFGSQAFLVGAYLWYKRRKAMGPKKYL